jgi:hypothetical protein
MMPPGATAATASATDVNMQSSVQTSAATQTPFRHIGVSPVQAFPQLPQLAASVLVLVQAAGVPQQVDVLPLQGLPPPHRHRLLAHMSPDGAQSPAAQQTPVKHSPPQQTWPTGQGLDWEHAVQTLFTQIGVVPPQTPQLSVPPQPSGAVPQLKPAGQLACEVQIQLPPVPPALHVAYSSKSEH